jgi:hypothetical protein
MNSPCDPSPPRLHGGRQLDHAARLHPQCTVEHHGRASACAALQAQSGRCAVVQGLEHSNVPVLEI